MFADGRRRFYYHQLMDKERQSGDVKTEQKKFKAFFYFILLKFEDEKVKKEDKALFNFLIIATDTQNLFRDLFQNADT